jgi:hypothetical protein
MPRLVITIEATVSGKLGPDRLRDMAEMAAEAVLNYPDSSIRVEDTIKASWDLDV